MLDNLLNVLAIMAWATFAIIVAVLAIRAFQIGGIREAVKALTSWRVFLSLFVAFTLSLLSASLVFVEPQQAGVVVSVISPDGYRDQPLRSGLHWIVPLAERVELYPIFWQNYTMSAEPSEGAKTGNDSIAARTSDGQAVYLDSSIIYRIDPGEVIRVHIDLQNRYIEDFIRPILRGLVRTEVSQFTADEVNSSKRKNLETNLEELIREALNDKGFVLDRFLLRNIAFSDSYASAIEQKQVAEQEQVQREYQAEQMRKLAEGERDKTILEAAGRANAILQEGEAEAKVVLLMAQAEAEALRLISQVLERNKDLITFRYIDKIAPGIRVMLVPNDNPYLLPLPDMSTDLLQTTPTPTPAPTEGETLVPTPTVP
jgi:regulator of protease activity HflC (stomatin/prohibitin superfamily)